MINGEFLSGKNPDGVLTLGVAGAHNNCGKTTLSLGMMSALIKRGHSVQALTIA
jgi:cobyrinic acid a,c-diamide synthase